MFDNPNHDEKIVYEQIVAYLKECEDMRREALEVKTVKDLLTHSLENNDRSTVLLIEYLCFEMAQDTKISLDDDISALDIYYNPKHRERLNKLIGEYDAAGKSIFL
jgi:hypothetical protein